MAPKNQWTIPEIERGWWRKQDKYRKSEEAKGAQDGGGSPRVCFVSWRETRVREERSSGGLKAGGHRRGGGGEAWWKLVRMKIPLFFFHFTSKPSLAIEFKGGNLHFHSLLLTLPATPAHTPPRTTPPSSSSQTLSANHQPPSPSHPHLSPPLTQQDHCHPLALLFNCNPHVQTTCPHRLSSDTLLGPVLCGVAAKQEQQPHQTTNELHPSSVKWWW